MFAVLLVPDNLSKVQDLISDAASKWPELGLELGLKEPTLKVIQVNKSGSQNPFREVVSTWLEMVQPAPTWEALIAALKKDRVRLPNLANKVEELCVGGSATSTPDAATAASSTSGEWNLVVKLSC